MDLQALLAYFSYSDTIGEKQEAVDMIQESFDIADQYRNPCLIVVDGLIGQMMEPIEWHDVKKRDLPPKTWAAVLSPATTYEISRFVVSVV